MATHLAEDRPADAREWLNDAHRHRGWTTYGGAVAEGLMAHLADVYIDRRRETSVLD
jgi:hypothetical protein